MAIPPTGVMISASTSFIVMVQAFAGWSLPANVGQARRKNKQRSSQAGSSSGRLRCKGLRTPAPIHRPQRRQCRSRSKKLPSALSVRCESVSSEGQGPVVVHVPSFPVFATMKGYILCVSRAFPEPLYREPSRIWSKRPAVLTSGKRFHHVACRCPVPDQRLACGAGDGSIDRRAADPARQHDVD